MELKAWQVISISLSIHWSAWKLQVNYLYLSTPLTLPIPLCMDLWNDGQKSEWRRVGTGWLMWHSPLAKQWYPGKNGYHTSTADRKEHSYCPLLHKSSKHTHTHSKPYSETIDQRMSFSCKCFYSVKEIKGERGKLSILCPVTSASASQLKAQSNLSGAY